MEWEKAWINKKAFDEILLKLPLDEEQCCQLNKAIHFSERKKGLREKLRFLFFRGDTRGFGLFLYPGPPGPDRWVFGWLTGPEGRDVCVVPGVFGYPIRPSLSPTARGPIRAVFAFLAKFTWVAVRSLWTDLETA